MDYPPVILATMVNSGTTLLGPVLAHALERHGYCQKRMLPPFRDEPHPDYFSDMESREFTFEHYNINLLNDILGKPEYKVLYLVRDLRDVIVSYYFHQRKFKTTGPTYQMSVFRRWLDANNISDIEAINLLASANRFNFSLNGQRYYPISFESLKELVEPWIEARDRGECMLIRFEDLIKDMPGTLMAIMDYLNLPASDKELKISCLEQDIFLKEGRKRGEEKEGNFFRKGSAGQWKQYFTDASVRNSKAILGNILNELNYGDID